MTTRSYRQFCALARALDHVGDRWTLLIVRELVRGPRTSLELTRGLPGISPSLLSERLAALQADGLVGRNDAPPRSKSVTYALTPVGAELEEVLLALVRWGTRWMAAGPAEDQVDPAWSGLALKALVEDTPRTAATDEGDVVHLRVDDETTTVRLTGGRRRVEYGAHGSPLARVTGPFPELLGAVSGLIPVDQAGLEIDGDADLARAALAPAAPSGRSAPGE